MLLPGFRLVFRVCEGGFSRVRAPLIRLPVYGERRRQRARARQGGKFARRGHRRSASIRALPPSLTSVLTAAMSESLARARALARRQLAHVDACASASERRRHAFGGELELAKCERRSSRRVRERVISVGGGRFCGERAEIGQRRCLASRRARGIGADDDGERWQCADCMAFARSLDKSASAPIEHRRANNASGD